MRRVAVLMLMVFLAGMVAEAAALNAEDVLALLQVGVRERRIIEVIEITNSKPNFTARQIILGHEEHRIGRDLLYLCLQAEPLTREQVYALARINFDRGLFVKLISRPGIAFRPDFGELAALQLHDDVRAALMAATPRVVEDPVVTRPERVQLRINITGEPYQTSRSHIYFYILVDGEVVREIVDDKVDVFIGTASYNKFFFTNYTETVETGNRTIAISIVPTDRGKPSQAEINSHIMFSKRINLTEGFNQLNLVSRLIPGTQSFELVER